MLRGLKLTLFALFCLLAVGQFVGTGASSQDPLAEKFFKNIQALKGIPASQIAGLMDSYNKALGVSCEYCHVAGDLSKGDKPAHKSSVRDIMMTREINTKYQHKVDCMSCHMGKAKPGGVAVVTGGGGTGGGTGGGGDPTGGPPAKLTFTASAGAVPFPHDTHTSMGCAKCHHQGGNSACATCHKHNNGDTGLSFKKVSHSTTSNRACVGCHTQTKAGPQACAACHKGDGGGGGGEPPKPMGPAKLTFAASYGKVGFPHDTHMKLDCSKCHHQNPNAACGTCHKHNAGDAGLSFKKVSHSTTSSRACMGCHAQMHAGPQTCAKCHKP